ncbi:hypothetical protein MCHIJ_29270 [Mycolicibacterium chitae]|nr:hypothetical protein MCHIJ_29270 [Mycolicibacterium chitae]
MPKYIAFAVGATEIAAATNTTLATALSAARMDFTGFLHGSRTVRLTIKPRARPLGRNRNPAFATPEIGILESGE